MGLETGTYLNDLVTTNPDGAVDPKSAGDDHLRLIKSTLKATFPGMAGAAWRVQSKATNYALAATDNMSQINVTAAATITGVAATLGNQFIVLIYNAHSAAITIPSYTLPAGSAVLMTCTGSAFHHFPFAIGSPTVTSLTTTGAVTVGNGATVSAGNLAVSAGTITASGNIMATAGIVNGTTNSQTSYSTAGLQSTSTSGNAGIGIHCAGSSAIWLQHTRGTADLTVCDSVGARAGVSVSYLDSTGIVRGGSDSTSYCYIDADGTNSFINFDNTDYLGFARATNDFNFVIGADVKVNINSSGDVSIDGGLYGAGASAEHPIKLHPSNDTYLYFNATDVGCYQTTGPTHYWHCQSGFFYSPVTYGNTTGVGANMVVALDGAMFRSTSLRKFKTDIVPLQADGDVFDRLSAVTYHSTIETDPTNPFLGFIAEDVAAVKPDAGIYDKNGELENYSDRAMIAMLWAEVQSLRRRVAELESR